MPPKRASAEVKAESPSRRKGGRPKRVEQPELDVEEAKAAEPEEHEEETTTSSSVKKRGRPKKDKTAVVEEEVETITLNIEDLIDLPSEVAAPAGKKRKAPSKSAASKKSKADLGLGGSKDLGAGGDVENLIQCTLCDAKVVQLVRHIRAQHGDDPDYDSKIKEARSLEAKVQSSQTPRKTASSNLLDDLTITVSKMEKAVPMVDRRTTGERGNSLVRPKNTQCPICEKVVRRYDLNKHIRNVHSGEKPNKCPYCDYASPWKGNLNTHIAGVHTKARLHDCIRCGLSFKTRSAMIGHVRKVHDKMYQPKERLFECEECNKKFYKKFHLQRHIRVHTGEKPFTCAFCEKMFASKTNMDSHIQSVHLKIKPFKCGYCEKGFARKKMMLIHIRKYHMNKDDNSLALAELDELDDITLDDNMDNESNASVESGEILAGEDAGMVLIKMRDDGAAEPSDSVKQYMFVPADELPSDLDNTLDTTANQSLDVSQSVSADDVTTATVKKDGSGESATAPSAGVAGSSGKKGKVAAAEASEPVVINVGPGQVMQALQTDDGIMLVAQSATITEHVDKGKSNKKQGSEPQETSAEEESQVEKEKGEQPDLVQQALSQTAPEVSNAAASTTSTVTESSSPSKTAAILNNETDIGGGLPANLLATEEGDQTETAATTTTAANGEVTTYFLADVQTNGD